MPHEWTHAERAGFCGGCNKPIAAGEPVRATTIHGVTRTFVRCEDCAGAAPPSLPARVVTAPDAGGFARFKSIKPETRGDLRRFYGSTLRAVVND